MDAIVPKPKVLFEAQPLIPYVREEEFDLRLKPGRALQEAHGLPAERASSTPTGRRSPRPVEAQQQRHGDPTRRSISCSSASRGGGLRPMAAPTARAQLRHAQKAAEAPEGWGISERIADITGAYEPKNDGRACFGVRAASGTDLGAGQICSGSQQLTPPQIIELACVVGFTNLQHRHDSLHIPVESTLLNDTGYVDL